MSGKYFIRIILFLALAAAGLSVGAQTKKPKAKSKPPTINDLKESRNNLVNAAKEYKESLEKLLTLLEDERKDKAETVEKRKALLEQSIISRRELEESEQALSAAQQKVDDTKQKLTETDDLIAEASAEVKLPEIPKGAYRATNAIIRYNGGAPWVITEIAKVQNFFTSRFGRSLPISAFGQSATHDRLGFDHHNNVDVAVHPDSAEGQALMAYLRSVGIPFIAFRQAVAGSATGAHIHIGHPSHRLVR